MAEWLERADQTLRSPSLGETAPAFSVAALHGNPQANAGLWQTFPDLSNGLYLGSRIRLARHLLRILLALVDDEVGRVPLDHDLDLRLLMFWNDRKVGRLGADRLVLDDSHRYRLRAVGAPAFAGEVDWFGVGLDFDEVRGDLSHALVDFPEERFIPSEAFVSCGHDADSLKSVDSRITFCVR